MSHSQVTPLVRLAAATLAIVVLIATGCTKPDLSELEKENRELRDELRDVREDLRGLRKDTRELREKVELLPSTAIAPQPEPPTSKQTEASTDPAGKTEPLAPPPKQGNVKISIASNPTGATVFLEEKILGKTPLLYQHAPSTTPLMVRIEKPGFRPRLMSIRPDEDIKLSVQLARQ